MGTVTWLLSRDYMVQQRETGAVRQAKANAAALRAAGSSKSTVVRPILDGFVSRPHAASFLRTGNDWVAVGDVQPQSLPPRLVALATSGAVVRQRVELEGVPRLVIGVPLNVGTTYVEVFPLTELDGVLQFISATLLACSAVGVLLAAAFADTVTRRLLRPLTVVVDAASRVKDGDLTARLPEESDPDLSRLARVFNGMTAALARRQARDKRFAGDVAHELRSPLTTLANAVAVLDRRRQDLDPSGQEAVELLVADVGRFERLVIDLLDLARADEGANGNVEEVDFVELLSQLRANGPLQEVPRVELPPGALRVLADRRRLERVIVNLVDNARIHGGGATRVRLRADGATCLLEVDDAGPGVPPEQRARIFERFARDDIRRVGGGVGLGLSLVYEHVRMDDGKVWVCESPDGGARFVVQLPCCV